MEFAPKGFIGFWKATDQIWRALHGDYMYQPIPFSREEERAGKVVQIDTPEEAKKHQEIGRRQAAEARDRLIQALADGDLVAEAKGQPVPREYWQYKDLASITISTGRLECRKPPMPTELHHEKCFIELSFFEAWLADRIEQRDHRGKAALRTKLKRWLEKKAKEKGDAWSKPVYRKTARAEVSAGITDNLFQEVWASANLPEAVRKAGRRT